MLHDLQRNVPRNLQLALAIIALAVLPFMVSSGLGNTWLRVLDFALLYVMLALGLNIVVGFAGLLDLGYIAFYAVGAYVYALLASPQLGLHWPVWAILPLGALAACGFGVVLGAPTLRLRGDYLAIVTLGFGEIVRIFMNNLNAPVNITNGPKGIAGIDPVQLGGHALSQPLEIFGVNIPALVLTYYFFLALVLIVMLAGLRLQDSRIGRAWAAIREDEMAAKACGINTRNVKLLAFAMGASFGGLAGGLFASFQEFVSPESFSLMESIMVLCMVVLGGMGHIPGVILGALVLTVLPEAFRHGAGPVQQAVFGQVLVDPENLRMLLFGLALVAVMLYRPSGLWPDPRHRQEFKSR
ncbi:ABC transporter permease subunit [Rugosibacter aromaticivorans]|uniref:ABC transporter permease subunit n=1 Tax=Rugosibacter aromaticivorans TaxID=1565605 RepID=UPI00121AE617|nr:ABC transporter ATP-binding protein [Rugosibacter aromaticivorans]TBR15609.1 MAG: ABC transporter ATP-binding protein [Rugosibacter sp.]